MESLEDRVLFDGVPDATFVLPSNLANDIPDAAQVQYLEQAEHSAPRELVLIDEGVKNSEQLLASILESKPSSSLEIRFIDSNSDGVNQISEILSATNSKYEAVHVLSHGTEGQIALGSTVVSESNLSSYADEVAGWSAGLSGDADLLFYGCNLAGSAEGQSLINSFSAMTGADVAASDDLTGHSETGGDFSLEYNAGLIETESILDSVAARGLVENLQITGTVFEDFNNNGTRDLSNTTNNESGIGSVSQAIDRGVGGIIVNAYDENESLAASAVTQADGTYSLSTGQGSYRIEFSLPANFYDGIAGANSSGSVQFVNDGSVANLGIHRPEDYSADNPLFVTNCYVFGDQVDGVNKDRTVLVSFRHSAGTDATDTSSANYLTGVHEIQIKASDVGTTWGLTYDEHSGDLFAAAFTKKHAGYGPDGNGAIYSIDSTGNVSLFADVNAIFGANTAGVDFRAGYTAGDDTAYLSDSFDTGWDAVGKTSLGGSAVSRDGETLYVMNLADRSLYALPTSGTLDSSTIRVEEIPLAPGATGVTAANTLGDLRPFAVTEYRGRIFVGMVNSAETTGSSSDLKAYVYEVFDDGTDLTFGAAPIFQMDLDYTRNSDLFSGALANWKAWEPTFSNIGPASVPVAIYPQPWLTDIAFDEDGNMSLGIVSRDMHQTGNNVPSDPANPSSGFYGYVDGEILRAFVNNAGDIDSGWTLESNARGPNNEGSGPQNTNLGPGGGEFYYQDNFQNYHPEIGLGGLAQVAGFGHVLTTVIDPAVNVSPASSGFLTQGIHFYDNTSGGVIKAHQLTTNESGTPPPLFGKAAGLGDIEAIFDLAPMEIGNRIWIDADRDGIQGAEEDVVPDGVTVELYDVTDPSNPILVGSTTTSNGIYRFNDTNVAYTDGGNPVGLRPNTEYEIRLTSVDFADTGLLARLSLTKQNVLGASDGINSDAELIAGIPTIQFTTGGIGESNHNLDIGLVTPDYGDLDDRYGTLLTSDGPSHVIDGTTFLGGSVDGELTGLPTSNALGDDNDSSVDDEDGIVFLNPLTAGSTADIQVTATPNSYLNAWIDFDSDGALDEVTVTAINGVTIPPTNINDLQLTNAVTTLTIDVPTDAEGTMAARFRLTSDQMGSARSSLGHWDNGEVEDYVLGAIGDVVFMDNGTGGGTGADGIQNGSEPGVANVTVNLLDSNGDAVVDSDGNPISTITAADGGYSFSGLPPDEYQVEFIAPNGLIFTQQNQGTDDALDSDANTTTGITATYDIEAGENNTSVDAGLLEIDLGDLPDSYGTTNLNNGAAHGLDGANFLGAGVDAELDGQPNANATGDDTIDGNDDEDGVVFLTPLTAGDNAQIEVTASQAGFLNAWIDFNSNGMFDTGEQIASDMALAAGANTLTVNVPPNATGTMAARFRFTSDDPNGELGSTGAWSNGEVEDYVLGALGNYVWEDNGAGGGTAYDGIQHADEKPVAGVTVYLLDKNGDRIADPVSGDDISTTTDTDGFYEFAGLPAGDYAVEFEAPGYEFTLQDQGFDDDADNDADTNGVTATTTIDAGETDNTLDAGIVEFDYGDLVDGYGTTNSSATGPAKHLIDDETFLGLRVDGEADGTPSANALGDDSDKANDDEDGIIFLTPLMPNNSADIQVNAGASGFLNGWIDFNSDGVLDEVIVTHLNGTQLPAGTTISDLGLSAGPHQLTIAVPADATGTMAARFRFTNDEMAGNRSPNGKWLNGEVEDYVLGSLGDLVFLDNGGGSGGTAADGIQNGTEPGLANVVVNLLDSNGDAVEDADGNPITTLTDSSGNYEFPGLPAGDYQVEFVRPEGYVFTDQDQGTEDALDSDADESGLTGTYSIAEGETDPTVDAGLIEVDMGDLPDDYGTANANNGAAHGIDGVTFLGAGVDAELDGQPNTNATGDDTLDGNDDEDGIVFVDPLVAGNSADIRVTASVDGYLNAWIDFDTDGTLDEVLVTHVNGTALVTPVNIDDLALTAGATTLTIEVPTNATGTMAARFRFSDDAMGTDRSTTGVWDNGEVEDYVLGAIGNFVWEDNGAGGGVAGDGIQDGNEPGVAGVTVYLLDGTGTRLTDPVTGDDISTTTDGNGFYEFAGLPPGDYSVEFVEPTGFDFTDHNTGSDDAIDSDADTTTGATFGHSGIANIEAGETDNTLDAGIVEYDYGDLVDGYGTTDGSNLGPARHVVDDVTFLGTSVDSEDDGQPTADAAGDGNDENGVIFLNPMMPGTSAEAQVTASVDGFLNAWLDFDSDGVLDEVLVTHVDGIALGTPVNINDLALNSGGTTLTIEVPANATGTMAARFRFSSDEMGALRSPNSDWDNGEVEDYVLGALGDIVWLDNGAGGGTGNDGIQNGTEAGIPNVVVNLLDGNGDAIEDADGNPITTITDSSGNYEFPGLPSGDYKVEFVLPTGMQFTETDQGSNDALDSDANETTGVTDQTYTIGANSLNPTVDAGMLTQDFGDLPDGYGTTTGVNGASHGIDGVTFLGTGVDAEINGQPTTNALGDDDHGDDEDGIVFLGPLVAGNSVDIEVTASVDGFLNAWIDFDTDGTLDEVTVTHIDGVARPTPVSINDLALTDGTTKLTIDVPVTATGTMAARFRFSNDAMGADRSPTGAWDNGEVEDYVLGAIGNYVWKDNGAGTGTGYDGIQDADEQAVSGVVVFLLDQNGDRIVDPVTGDDISTTTDSNGFYEFAGLPPGDYALEFVAPGYEFTQADQGIDDTVDSDADVNGITAITVIDAGETDDTLDAGIVGFDYGDLDDVYGTTNSSLLGAAKHIVDGSTFLGLRVDDEADGTPTADGTGDDNDTSPDDEDGVIFLNPLVPGTSAEILVNAGSDGFLNGWIDFNSDGVLDEVNVTHLNGIQLPPGTTIADLSLSAGANRLTFDVPSDADGTMAARFRFTNDEMGVDRAPNGMWINGEVEDYVLGALGDVVFLDNGTGGGTGGDGIQNGAEPGVEGVVVKLLNGNGDAVLDADDNPITTLTNSDGNYEFSGLPIGDYQVEFILPDGHIFTDMDTGTDDALDSDADETTGITDTYSIVAGENNPTVDAGIVELDLGDLDDGYGTTLANGGAAHGIDGMTFLGLSVDSELDGQPNANATGDDSLDGTDDEDGVLFLGPLTAGDSAEIQVTANVDGYLNAWIDFDSDGTLDEVTVTHLDGVALTTPTTIADLMLTGGSHVLTIDVPADATGTMAARFRFSDDMMGTDRSPNGIWNNGEVEDYVLGSIGNYVWEDNGAGRGVSGDGIQDSGEPAVQGVAVYLLDQNGDRIVDPVTGSDISTTTDANGFYEFAGLPPGGYAVEFVAPAYEFTDQDAGSDDTVDSDADVVTGVTDSVGIEAGETDNTLDAGLVEYDYGDLNDGYGTTNASGLGPAKHVIDDVTFLGAGVDNELDGSPTADATGDDSNAATDDEDGVLFLNPMMPGTSADIQVTASVDGFLNAWIDFDSDGVLDEVTVTHVDGISLPSPVDINDLALTAGETTFTVNVPANATGTMAARFRFTSNEMGTDRSPNNDWDNGEVEDYVLGSIGDIVWMDNGDGGGTGNDGIQNGSEAGIPNVVVNLLDANGTPILDANGDEVTTMTDGQGNYEFPGLPEGDYKVEFVLPTGMQFTDTDQGTDDALDSDANEQTGVTDQTYSIGPNTTDLSVDAGMLQQDFGDLPDGYGTTTGAGGASHGIDGVTFLGSGVDAETEGQPTANGLGDDDNGDDEDGVAFLSPLTAGDSAVIRVSPNVDGYLNAWIDFNSDGTLDEVTVTHVDGIELAVPTTIADLKLTGGSHVLTIDVPTNAKGTMAARFRFSDDMMGADRSTTGEWDNGEVEDYVLGSIGNFVFEDNGGNGTGVAGDGIQDANEPGVEGVTVYLLDGNGDRIADPTSGDDISTVTDADGFYEFAGLPARDYAVEFVEPTGFDFTDQDVGTDDMIDSDSDFATGVTAFTNIEAGETDDTLDAGIVEYDYGDLDDVYGTTDGATLGPARHVVDDVTFLGGSVDSEDDGSPTAGGTGDDVDATTDDEDGITFLNPLMPGTSADVEVTASVDGFLNAWIDFNSNGTLDEVTVTHVDGVALATPVDINDLALAAGATTLRVEVPTDATGTMAARFRFTSDEMGSDRSPNNDWDNGEVEDYVLGSIGDVVWMDNGDGGGTGNDGIQNGTEAGIPNVVVNLLDGNGAHILDANGDEITTMTDASGNYEFSGLPEGDYKVEFVLPTGMQFTETDQGTDDALDSDANEQTGVTDQTFSIGPNTTDLSIDAGMLQQDFGDLDDGYGTTAGTGGASHGIDGATFLGGGVDAETDGQPTANALGDDDNGDDEDGVVFLSPLTAGDSAEIQVSPSVDGYLNAWIDFDSDGALDEVTVTHVDGVVLASPTTIADLVLTGATHVLTIDVPTDATGTMAARFRFSNDMMGADRSPTGEWDNGEVEDYVLGTIGDTVWLDDGTGGGVGNDGIQNGGETGVEGVVVNLLDANGAPVLDGDNEPVSTTTDADGNYEFAGLPPGDYTVEFELPEGMQFTDTDQGSDDLTDSDANEQTGVTDQVYTIEPGTNDDSIDAGLLLQDFGDLPDSFGTTDAIGGALHGIDGSTFLGTGVDDELDGQPSADALGDDQSGTDDDDGVTFATPLAAGTTAEVEVVASTDGYLNAWVDFNSNGTFDAGEQVATDVPLGAGANTITFDVPSDATGVMAVRFRFTSDDPDGAMTSVGAWDNGEVEDYILNSIGNTVWYDNGDGGGVAGDGIQDPLEPGLEGVVVNLLDGNGDPILDGAGVPISTTTDADGSYEFAGLPDGDYSIQVITPVGFAPTIQNVGSDDATDSDVDREDGTSDVVSVSGGEVIDTLDAGMSRYDFGDLPYGETTLAEDGARHVVDQVTFLGQLIDVDGDGLPDPDALGDDNDGMADDDGVAFLTPLMPGTSANVQVEPSVDGFLNAWIDFDSDGTLDEVTVTHVDGVALPSPTTIADLELTGGSHVLTIEVPANATGEMAARFRFTNDEMGDDRSASGEWDNGEVEDYMLGTLGNRVFFDMDDLNGNQGDGIQNHRELNAPGVNVYLTDIDGNRIQDANGNDIVSVTDELGNYEFSGLATGDYRVEFELPEDHFFTLANQGPEGYDSDANFETGLTDEVYSICPGKTIISADAGILPDASLGNRIWFDIDGDGQQDPGEPGMAGIDVQVEIDINGDGTPDYTETATTDAAGEYLFESLPPGASTVTLVNPPTGFTGTFSADGGSWSNYHGELAGDEDRTDIDFGLTGTSSIAGTVHEDGLDDLDSPFFADGIQDAIEPGISGVTITLEGITGTGISFTRTTTTDENGDYSFENLPPGSYTLIETQPTSEPISVGADKYLDGLDSVGSLGGVTSANTFESDTISNIVLGDEEHGADYDFSEIPEADPNGFVFVDSNDNGIMDPGEEGIPGVLITLEGVDVFGASVQQTTVTDENGFYFFDQLNAGTYRLLETQPQGYNDGQEQNGTPPFTVSNDQFSDIVLGWGDLFEGYNFGELEQGTTGYPSRLAPLVSTVQPFLSNLISGIGNPGPIYAGIPINTNANPLSLESSLPVAGGYSTDIGQSVGDDCCPAECLPAEIMDACGETFAEPTMPVIKELPSDPRGCGGEMPGVNIFEGVMDNTTDGAIAEELVSESETVLDDVTVAETEEVADEMQQTTESSVASPSFLKRIGSWLTSSNNVQS
jgi:hypothetical protein